MDPQRLKDAYQKLQSLDERMTHKVRPRPRRRPRPPHHRAARGGDARPRHLHARAQGGRPGAVPGDRLEAERARPGSYESAIFLASGIMT